MKACPLGGGLLNATVTITLYDVEIENGEVIAYDGGPTPESNESFLEVVNDSRPTIVCVNGHSVESV